MSEYVCQYSKKVNGKEVNSKGSPICLFGGFRGPVLVWMLFVVTWLQWGFFFPVAFIDCFVHMGVFLLSWHYVIAGIFYVAIFEMTLPRSIKRGSRIQCSSCLYFARGSKRLRPCEFFGYNFMGPSLLIDFTYLQLRDEYISSLIRRGAWFHIQIYSHYWVAIIRWETIIWKTYLD